MKNVKNNIVLKELKVLSNKAANVLVDKANVQKGDRVFIFMPRTPELYFAFLGILKLVLSLVHYLKLLWKSSN